MPADHLNEVGLWDPGELLGGVTQSDLEQRVTRADRRSNANKRAHCSNQRRSGQKEGQRSVDVIPLRTDEVPHLVSKQDAQQGSAKRNSQHEAGRMLQGPMQRKDIRVGLKLR